jgi:hypothetical protein
MAMNIKITVFSGVMLDNLVDRYRRFGEIFCPILKYPEESYIQGRSSLENLMKYGPIIYR